MVGNSKFGKRTATQRQKLMSDYFSQPQSSQSSTIVQDTQPSQMGKQPNKLCSRTEAVVDSQAEFSNSDEDLFPKKSQSKTRYQNNSMSAFRRFIEESDDEEIIAKETVESQMQRPKMPASEDVVYDSQEDNADDDAMNLDDVHTQMSFHPAHTSTQKPAASNLPNNLTTVNTERKRKKTSALTERPTKKLALTNSRRSFDFTTALDPTPIEPPPSKTRAPYKRAKLSSHCEAAQEDLYPEESQKMTKKKTPATQKTTQQKKKQGSLSFSDDEGIEITLISSGNTYETEDNFSFLSQLPNKGNIYSEDDISKISASLQDLVEVMSVTGRDSTGYSIPPKKSTTQQSSKKFKKAAQGRYNPRLSTRQPLICDENLKDFRAF